MNPTTSARSRCRQYPLLLLFVLPVASACAGPAGSPADEAAGDARDNSRERLNLEPLPDNAMMGPDGNGDHIRDDVEALIDERFGDDEYARLAVRQFARGTQHLMSYAQDHDRAFAAAVELQRGMQCLAAKLGPAELDRLGEIERRTIDTEERLVAYFAAHEALGGGAFSAPRDGRDACAFDLEGLAP